MSPRTRIAAVVAATAVVAAAAVVGIVVLQTRGEHTGRVGVTKPLPGFPPLRLDLGVRIDPEAQALRRASVLYAQSHVAAARQIFDSRHSVEAQLGSAFVRWPGDSLDRVKRLFAAHPTSAEVALQLGIAEVWAGRTADGTAVLRAVRSDHPDTQAAVDAANLLFAGPPGVPPFVPTFAPPASVERLPPPQRLAALARAATRPDAHAKLLYGTALQSLGRSISAERQFAAAARLAPKDPEAQVAAILGTFDKAHPDRVFPRLGPLVRRFPRAATVRFHLGLALIWINQFRQARIELRQVSAVAPASILARQAESLLARLGRAGTK